MRYLNEGPNYTFDVDQLPDGGESYTPQVPGEAPADPVPVNQPAVSPISTSPVPVAATAAIVPLPTPTRAPTALPTPVIEGVARYAADDYAAAARALLPRGRAWPDDPASMQGRMLAAIGATFARSDAALNGMLAGSVPGRPTSTLPEWEAALGLPDPCAGDAPTIAQRLDQVRGRFVGAGGQSRDHFIDYAAALGFTITITNYAPFRAGMSAVGQPVASDEWSFVWGVSVVATTGSLPIDVLFCELEVAKPAESTLLFLGVAGDTALAGADYAPLLATDGTPLLL